MKAVIFDMYETLITHWGHPQYFGEQIAVDAGIPAPQFLSRWRETETPRTLGQVTFEEVIAMILRVYGRYSDSLLERIVQKRIAVKEECFRHLHPEIIPMMEALKSAGIKIGLISNCYLEEAAVIRQSVLFPYFDAVCLSCEEGVYKPDEIIFHRCLERLRNKPQDCLYVGDGGSRELEAARDVGMKAVQALWYAMQNPCPACERMDGFPPMTTPMDILKEIM